jgi:uncharacterized Zn finger protein
MFQAMAIKCDICGLPTEHYRVVRDGRAVYRYCPECASTLKKIIETHHWPAKFEDSVITILG